MSSISILFNFDTHEEAIAFLSNNPQAAATVAAAAETPAPAPAATSKSRAKPAKSFGPAVAGDPEGTRYWSKGDDLFKTTKDLDATSTKLVDGATEISGVDFLAKKEALATKLAAEQGRAASPAPATETAAAEGQSGSDGDFDPFADDAASAQADVSEAELLAKLKALSNVKDGRAKLTEVLTKHGDGKSVPNMLKAATTAAKRVEIFQHAEKLIAG